MTDEDTTEFKRINRTTTCVFGIYNIFLHKNMWQSVYKGWMMNAYNFDFRAYLMFGN